MTKDQFPPSISAGRLYERTSAKGNVYLSGYWGPLRLTAFKSDQTDDNGNPIWNLKIAEAPPRDKPSEKSSDAVPAEAKSKPEPIRKPNPRSDWQRPTPREGSAPAPAFDEIPF